MLDEVVFNLRSHLYKFNFVSNIIYTNNTSSTYIGGHTISIYQYNDIIFVINLINKYEYIVMYLI